MACWLHVITVGATRPRGPFAALEEEFVKRIRRFASLERHRVASSRRRSASERRREEAQRLAGTSAWSEPGSRTTIALDVSGNPLDSPAFGEFLRRCRDGGGASFLVGGPDGLDPALLASSAKRLSLGRMTLPHELALVVLLEQIYRALAAEHNHPYSAH